MAALTTVYPPGSPPSTTAQIRVLVVDDSTVLRKMIARILASDPVFILVGEAANGFEAVAKAEQLNPDVITMDVEMPEMDGMVALQQIRARLPRIRVIMCSRMTTRGASHTIDALLAGASDYVPKPQTNLLAVDTYEQLRRDLVYKIRQMFPATSVPKTPKPTAPPEVEPSAASPAVRRHSLSPPGFLPKTKPRILVIGVSTGGPSALAEIFPTFAADFPIPILIVQHMPPLFTHLLAERLTKLSRIKVKEATPGMRLEAGTAILAPGDFHMRIVQRLSGFQVELNQEERENSCRPAVDVLFRSAAELFGGAALAVVLTGMGQDGLEGVRSLKQNGASVIIQNKETSVVWGMPGAIAAAGLADSVLPLNEIVPTIERIL